MNKAIIIGNLVRDPELRTTQSDLQVCSFTVAVSRSFSKEKDEADFIPVVTWRKLAENCGKYLLKGKKVAVSGHIQTRVYDDNKNNKRYITELIADEVEFLSPKEIDEKPRDPKDSGFTDLEPLDDFSKLPF